MRVSEMAGLFNVFTGDGCVMFGGEKSEMEGTSGKEVEMERTMDEERVMAREEKGNQVNEVHGREQKRDKMLFDGGPYVPQMFPECLSHSQPQSSLQ